MWATNPQGFWLGPAVFGAALIVIGVIIYRNPALLAYAVAAIFIMAGAVMIGVAWKMRTQVTIHRMDHPGDGRDEP